MVLRRLLEGGIRMTVGELMALLVKHSSDEDYLLMAKGIDDIEIRGDYATLYFTDGNTEDIILYEDGRWEYRRS